MNKKKIISASMVAVAVLISMFALCGVVNAGVTKEEGRRIFEDGTAIIGERNLSFWYFNRTTNTTEMCNNYKIVIDNKTIGGIITKYFDSYYHEDKLVGGKLYTVQKEGQPLVNFTFEAPDLKVVEILDERDKKVSKVLKGENITFVAETNLNLIEGPLPNNISYKLVDPRGGDIRGLENIPLVGTKNVTTINTAQLDEGEYKLSVKADPLTNNGLDAEGSSVTFTIEKKITITPDVEKQAVNKEIIFKVTTTSPRANVSLNVTGGDAANVNFLEFVYKEGVIEKRKLDFPAKTDEDGNFKARANFTEPGVYEITATYIEAKANNIKARTTVEIEEFSAAVSVEKTKYYVGDHVNISGYVNAGDNITIKVDNETIETDLPIGEFSCIWRTAGSQPGSYEIGVWVLPFSKPDSDPPDASVTIILMQGGLSATVDKVVALGDEFEIEGIAPGCVRVDILTISPKGGGGDGFDSENIPDAPGLTHSRCSVFPGGEFKEKIKVREDADTGLYLIAVLSYGRDRVWGTTGSDDLIGVLNYSGSLAVKTQEQILAILKDRTINCPGSDDLLYINTIKVENPEIILDDVEDVFIGGDIVVSGYTNRKRDSAIIITIKGPVELKPKLAFVNKNGTFNVSFSTVSAKIGEYTVTADDGKGYIDTKSVSILLPTTPLLSTGNSSDNSSSLSPAPATGASSQSQSQGINDVIANSALLSRMQAVAKKQPGFEMIFGIIGLVVAVWLGLKKRRKG